MTKLPILFNGNFQKVVGNIEFSDELLDLYTKEMHLVINPMIHKQLGKEPEVVAFCVYPMPTEPVIEKKKRGRPKKEQPASG